MSMDVPGGAGVGRVAAQQGDNSVENGYYVQLYNVETKRKTLTSPTPLYINTHSNNSIRRPSSCYNLSLQNKYHALIGDWELVFSIKLPSKQKQFPCAPTNLIKPTHTQGRIKRMVNECSFTLGGSLFLNED